MKFKNFHQLLRLELERIDEPFHVLGRLATFNAGDHDLITSALIISDAAYRDPDGMLLSVGHVYWNPNYQVDDEIEQLRTAGAVLFRGVW